MVLEGVLRRGHTLGCWETCKERVDAQRTFGKTLKPVDFGTFGGESLTMIKGAAGDTA